jgi:hypothetical protein
LVAVAAVVAAATLSGLVVGDGAAAASAASGGATHFVRCETTASNVAMVWELQERLSPLGVKRLLDLVNDVGSSPLRKHDTPPHFMQRTHVVLACPLSARTSRHLISCTEHLLAAHE